MSEPVRDFWSFALLCFMIQAMILGGFIVIPAAVPLSVEEAEALKAVGVVAALGATGLLALVGLSSFLATPQPEGQERVRGK